MISISTTPMMKVALRWAVARPGMLKEAASQPRIAGVSAATASADSRVWTASLAVLPALAASHSTTRGESAAIVEAWAVIQSLTAGKSTAGMGA